MGLSTSLRQVALAAALSFLLPCVASAAEVLCDTSYQDCRAMLLARIQNETDAIDIAMLFMEDDALADAIIAKHAVGVRVRMLVEPRRNKTTPKNEIILERLKAAGIPMRAKSGGGMLHWKFMVFNAQNVVQFSAANYSDYYFKPTVPYANYTDEGIFFSDQGTIVDSFRRRFEDAWIDTAGFFDYGNITAAPTRLYPLYSIDPDLSFVPWENFATRSVPLYDAEQQRIDSIMYKVTESRHADGLIRAARRGVPVRLITEGERYRNRSNMWQAYHIDRLYMAGVKIRDRAHEGFLHQKSTLLYGQGLTIFGSSNWTSESNSSQYEHNYFTDKAWFFDWFKDNFERKWTNRTGTIETVPFQPLPPDPPSYVSPANGATGVAASSVVLKWTPGIWAWGADIYFGTSATPPLLKADLSISAGQTASYTLPTLAPATTYYWKIVSKTMAKQTAEGPVYSFRTAGDTVPNTAPVVSITAPANNATFTAPATVAIAASASDTDGSVVRVEFYAGATLLGSDLTAPFQFTWNNVPAGNYSLTARAVDDDGASSTSSAVAISVTNTVRTLPAPWQSQDIGSVGVSGSAEAIDGTFTVKGAGADIWGTADAFQFAWQRVTGDVDVVARVGSVQNVNAWTKAGVMIRNGLTANAAHAFMLVSPGKGRAFQRRAANGGTSTHTSGGSGTAPVWVKLERRSATVRAYLSQDGVTWTLVGSDTFTFGTDTYVGLAVSSHDATRLATATFDNVRVTGATDTAPLLPAPWTGQDIGAVGVAGSAAAADGLFTIKGAGADVWGTADAFQFVWQPIDGDVDVIARVASVQYVQAWVKAGVMIREQLTPDSAHAFMIVSAGKGLAFQRRLATGGLSTHTSGGAGTAPAWVKLERRGNVISAFVSGDGVTWTFVGTDTFTMPTRVYVGLAVSSHDATRLATATFDSVTVTPR